MPPVARFGSSGIRGPYGTEITPELALAIGRAVGAMRPRVVVGRDARTSSPLLEQALVAGLLASGARVARAGVLPTPALAHAARAFDGGVVVTASHNPAPDNGIKLWNPDGKAFGASERAEVEALLRKPPPGTAWAQLQAATEHDGAIREHSEAIRRVVGPLPRRLRVVVDCGNGAACLHTPLLLRALGCEVISLNAQPDGAFPGRPSEPEERNLSSLVALVRAAGADLGLAHDGDADRCMAVTESGRFVGGDELLAIFAAREARRRIAVPVDASRAVDLVVPSGVEVVRTRVGDAYVSEAVADRGCDFGGEASGAWIFPRVSLCPDGPLAAALLCRIVADEGSLDKIVEALPTFLVHRESVRVPVASHDAFVAAAGRALEREGRLTTLDGVRVDSDDGWVLVRASGTEPKVRLTVEARERDALERLLRRGRAALQEARSALPPGPAA